MKVPSRERERVDTFSTVVHDFNGHEVNGIHGLYGKKGYDEALNSVNKRHDFTGMHDINGKFPYDDIFRKNHARLYLASFSPHRSKTSRVKRPPNRATQHSKVG